MIADLEDLEELDALDIHPRRIKAKEVLISQKEDEFIFPIADGTAKVSRRDCEFRAPSPRREQLVRREDLRGEFQGELEEPQPTESKGDAEARRDVWSFQGDFINRHHVPKEETFAIPLKLLDVTKSAQSDLDVLQEKKIDDC